MSGQHLCPSAPAAEGAILLGVVGPDGELGYVQPLIEIDAEFLDLARERGRPEERFRFSSPCLEAGCGYWTGSACGVLEQVLSARDKGQIPPAEDLPHCMIRRSCRWYAQSGSDACLVCPFVITSTGTLGAETRVAEVPQDAAETLTAGSRS
ncbi:MAG TPA: hypothetical protein VLA05_04345 [Coriobacteriia bacterium]|nr:hypothetical protein [Coriobacteriia bacterium]